MHILTRQQKLENLQEILAQKENKVATINREISLIKNKIKDLEKKIATNPSGSNL